MSIVFNLLCPLKGLGQSSKFSNTLVNIGLLLFRGDALDNLGLKPVDNVVSDKCLFCVLQLYLVILKGVRIELL